MGKENFLSFYCPIFFFLTILSLKVIEIPNSHWMASHHPTNWVQTLTLNFVARQTSNYKQGKFQGPF